MDRLYCTIKELVEDLNLPGVKNDESMLTHMRAASQFIEQQLGQFLPTFETRNFSASGSCLSELLVPPLLSVTSITNDGVMLVAGTDYSLQPEERHWRNGPYSWIRRIDGAWSSLPDGIVITGNWGLHEETVSPGIAATSLLVGDTSLAVANGSLISPGMALLVESEQILVTGTGAASDSTANLGAACTADDDELTLTDGTKIGPGEVIKIGFEYMRVLDVETNTALVQRGWNESRRAAHLISTDVYVQRTFNIQRGVNGTTAAAHTTAAVQRYVAPADVNYLCRQIAALMLKKAQTGFVGRSGNDDLGTGFWVNEFPKNQIEAVRSNYFWGGR